MAFGKLALSEVVCFLQFQTLKSKEKPPPSSFYLKKCEKDNLVSSNLWNKSILKEDETTGVLVLCTSHILRSSEICIKTKYFPVIYNVVLAS